MNEIDFIIPGEPVGKGRPRYSRKSNHMYTPKRTVEYEQHVKECFNKAMAESDYEPISKGNPIHMEIYAFFKPAKSTSKKKLKDMIADVIKPTKKPDMDNIVKIIADALNGVAFYDDVQVTWLFITKRYAEESCVRVVIKEDA